MALSIVDRPNGYVLATTGIQTTSISSSAGALFGVLSGHGLTTGDYIYIYGNLSEYNGYWYVVAPSGGTFRIYKYPTATVQPYVNTGTVTFYKSVFTHKWNCVHLPIVYKLKSTVWPINSVDTSRTVSSFADDSGYTELTLSGSLGTFNALDFILIASATTPAVNGVFQILTKTSTSVVTINLAYDAAYVFTSGTVILYYNNYHARIKIYAGIKTSHIWTAQKAYAQILELKIVPDSSGVITLNIAEYIKDKIEILKNDLLKDTLPNNLDAWDNFYITYAESYDSSDGTIVLTTVGSYTDDSANLQGYAVNAENPFQTRSAGALSQYVYGGTVETRQKFLTPFVRPTLFVGEYFDISFIIDDSLAVATTVLVQQLYMAGVLQNIVFTQIGTVNNPGVFRKSLTQVGTEDRQDVLLASSVTLTAPSTWTDGPQPFGSKGATAFQKLNAVSGVIYSAYQLITVSQNSIVTVSFNILVAGSWSGGTHVLPVRFYLADSSGVQVSTLNFSPTNVITANGSYNIVATITATSNAARLYVDFSGSFSGGQLDVTITITPGITGYDLIYSETKTIDVDSTCANQSRYLTWLNNLGGFDYWDFTARKVYGREIQKVVTQDKNIFTDYPKSIGEFAQTRTGEIKRTSKRREMIRSQNLTAAQVDAIATIKDSPLVQIVESQYSQRTVLVDNQSFDIRKDGDKNWKISFVIIYTDEMPSQKL